jgi:hypothetical protein
MQTSRRALVMPFADFWLMGGLSLVVLAPIWLAADWAHLKPVEQGLAVWIYYAGFAVNDPHFAFSYQLFYRGFVSRLRGTGDIFSKLRLVIAGVVAPLAMIAYFAAAFFRHSVPMLCDAAILMLFLVGWHYAKQGYGVLITSSVYRSIFYSALQKRIFYANAYIVWIYSWIIIHTEPAKAVQFDLMYSIPVVPHPVVAVATVAVIVSGMLTAAAFVKTAVIDKKGISWNGVTGYLCSIYVWLLLPQLVGSEAVFMAVPFFHGLQYWPFVYKYKKSEYGDDATATLWRNRWVMLGLFGLAGAALGDFFLEIGPKFADGAYAGPPGFTKNFFLIAFTIFINIHHYLIDHSFWRRDNAGAQQFLFKA